MDTLIPINSLNDIPQEYQNTPIAQLLEYHNLGKPFDRYDNAQLPLLTRVFWTQAPLGLGGGCLLALYIFRNAVKDFPRIQRMHISSDA